MQYFDERVLSKYPYKGRDFLAFDLHPGSLKVQALQMLNYGARIGQPLNADDKEEMTKASTCPFIP